ncbi:hypothetical protein F5051DRAFT_446833 [Lentinula edodes]|nr:hypothetical protein F5051DRAFT_446833 [Lentinula edodes]
MSMFYSTPLPSPSLYPIAPWLAPSPPPLLLLHFSIFFFFPFLFTLLNNPPPLGSPTVAGPPPIPIKDILVSMDMSQPLLLAARAHSSFLLHYIRMTQVVAGLADYTTPLASLLQARDLLRHAPFARFSVFFVFIVVVTVVRVLIGVLDRNNFGISMTGLLGEPPPTSSSIRRPHLPVLKPVRPDREHLEQLGVLLPLLVSPPASSSLPPRPPPLLSAPSLF